MREDFGSSFDRISDLPVNILQTILMLLTLRDMARTSILSKYWRYQWTKVPQLIFEDSCSYNTETIFGILLQHDGPIWKFTLCKGSSSAIDKIVYFLSRNGIQDLTLWSDGEDECEQLPSSILSCVELRHLNLYTCVFQPLTFAGFTKLVSLELWNLSIETDVSISSFPLLESLKLENLFYFQCFSVDAPKLKSLYFKGCFSYISCMNTPLLEVLSLAGLDYDDMSVCNLDLMYLLRSLPLLVYLHLHCVFLKSLVVDDCSNEHQIVLNNLKKLQLDSVNLVDMDDLSSTLWLLRSSPNLQKLKIVQIELVEPAMTVVPGRYLKMKEDLSSSFLNLQEVELELYSRWSNLCYYVEFLKVLLAILPELNTIFIKPGSEPIDMSGYKMLLDLACVPRLSTKAKIVCVGL